MAVVNQQPFSLNVPPDVELDLNICLNNKRLYSEFYAGYSIIAELSRGNRVVQIVTEGELRVSLGDDSFRGGCASGELIERGLKDADLAEMIEREEFDNCNWFNLYVGASSEDCNISTESVISTLDEAISGAISLIGAGESEWREELSSGRA